MESRLSINQTGTPLERHTPDLTITLARSAGHLLTFIWLTLSLLLYIVGSIGVTIFFNVPRNSKLASLAPDSDEAAAYWPIYIREWTAWNHVRTAACLIASALSIAGLAAAVNG